MSNGEPGGSVPLIPLHDRPQCYGFEDDHGNLHGNLPTTPLNVDTSYKPARISHYNMSRNHIATKLRPRNRSRMSDFAVIASYVLDWVVIIATLGVSFYLGHHTPNKRPFSLEDLNISFPYTEDETVPTWLLMVCCAVIPIVSILVIALIFVPGRTVPRGTPKALIWKRKLWELHVGWLGLAFALASAWFITNGMKNLFGKPRPDLLSRCNPDIENFSNYIVGGENLSDGFQRLVSANICRGVQGRDLDDGFRSYPSGHSSSSAAGLIYLSLFIASKFAITFPFLATAPSLAAAGPATTNQATTFSAFPSRLRQPSSPPPPSTATSPLSADQDQDIRLPPHDPLAAQLYTQHNQRLASARRQAAGPPLYLLFAAAAPLFIAIFIASSRWFDFRHHGFDILFGFLIGTVCAFLAFRWYHLPVSYGAGWAWGPRCADKAFWAGVGSLSYATDWDGCYGDYDDFAADGYDAGASRGTTAAAPFQQPPRGEADEFASRGDKALSRRPAPS